ncbi:hypothetical protein VB715_09425 [Crocosphaera sp. UHCC 0190]|uniref:hypothetical protein n=1 Tax=Crocosphaera sp. UHCC 0190 TaxID=3110246 RepID=UPI002B1FCDE8|nr:hypothetical protein [Crocosphaera sp. UHCC 0190]MEA5509984.1 hypothetical protein [Crocosphaera sp. UHCC 0190]
MIINFARILVTNMEISRSTDLLKKTAVTCLVLVTLWSHLVQNSSIRIPFIPNLLTKVTSFLGMSGSWQMFSVVDRFSWRLDVVAIHQNGEASVLPIFSHKEEDNIKDNFVNFRDGKLQQSLFHYQDAREHYTDYLCRIYQDANNPIKAIRFDLFWRQILPPEQSAIRQQYLTEEFSDKGKLGEFQCRN